VSGPGRPLRDQAPATWWKSFFGEDYLLLYGKELTSDRSAREVDCAIRAAGLRPGERVLDLGCGFGRHLKWLRRYKIQAFGLERSPVQIALARSPSDAGPSLPLARGDVRLLPFGSEFDAAVCLYTSMGYFDDAGNQAQLRELARVVRPGGRVLIDNQNPAFILSHLQPERQVEDAASQIRVSEQFEYDAESRRIYSRKEIRTPSAHNEYFFVLRLFGLDDLTEELERVGLQVEAAYGDYDLIPYGPDTNRLIVTARKP